MQEVPKCKANFQLFSVGMSNAAEWIGMDYTICTKPQSADKSLIY